MLAWQSIVASLCFVLVFSPSHGLGAQNGPFLTKGQSGWKYWDARKLPVGDWTSIGFDDSRWNTGQAPLGYGDRWIKTKVSYGDQTDKHPVACFRYKFDIKNPTGLTKIAGGIMSDDGAVIYLNGKEVFRRNLPDGLLEEQTRSTHAISGGDEQRYWVFLADAKLLKQGTNVVAVRVHQRSKTSSDLSMDMELRSVSSDEAKDIAKTFEQERAREVRLWKEQLVFEVRPQFALPAEVVAPRAQDVDLRNGVGRRGRRDFIHLHDRTMKYVGQDGIARTQTTDAIIQAKTHAPTATFVRALEGDTLATVALQRGLSVEQIRILNRAATDKSLADNQIVLVGWTHMVRSGETLASVARIYNTKTDEVATLNQVEENHNLKPGKSIQVPGEFQYVVQSKGNSYLRLARYPIPKPSRRTPYIPHSLQAKTITVKQGQTLESLAKDHNVSEEYLRLMNSLEKDYNLPVGRRLLVKYSVKLDKDSTLDDVTSFFQLSEKKLLAVNRLKHRQELIPGQRLNLPIAHRMGLSALRLKAPVVQGAQVRQITLGGD